MALYHTVIWPNIMSCKRTVLLIFLSPLVLLLLITVVNPLRWPQSLLENYVLSITPISPSFDDVISEVESRNWAIDYANKSHGFYDQRTRESGEVGSMSIRASLGDYQGLPFMANVTVFWGLDSSASLIDIWVWKTWDGF